MAKTTLAGLIALLSAFCISGCGDESTSKNSATPEADGGTEDGGPTGDATGSASENFEELMAQEWTLEPGVEDYYCVFQTLTEDLWVNRYRPIASPGTHHVTIGITEPTRPDGVVPNGGDIGGGIKCNGITLGDRLAFGGLVGTDEFVMPEGVAVKIPAGKQLLLSVHVFNGNDTPISGRSGVEVVRADPATVENQAEILFINNVGLQVPPGKSTQKGTCTLDADSTFFAFLHHMHERGVHMTTKVLPARGDATTVLDGDYTFTEQKFVMAEPTVKLAKGDKVEVTCDYENPGTNTLTFGESTGLNEMCITAAYRYPASAVNFNCLAVP